MAYQAFYNKYRPQTFDQVVGQKAIVTTLENAIKENKIGHAYLFCGPRGTGKTTMARLFAKALNCEEGLGKQCNDCQSCDLIMKGEHPDVFELDAASNSSVDDIRHIVENVSYQPIMSRYKVYIIDEVHSISKDAFNALLKTLEEPPSFVVFILATTEPQQILPTILSRVQRFDFSKVSEQDLIHNMERVLTNEHINYEPEALKLISSLSDGGVRDSLSLLEKVCSYCDDNVKVEDITELLGLLSTADELKLIQMMARKDVNQALLYVKDRYERGADIKRLHNDLIAIMKDYLIYRATRNADLLEKLSVEEVSSLNLNPAKVRSDIDYLIQSLRNYRLSEDIFSEFELTLLRLTSDEMPVMQQVATTSTPVSRPSAPRAEAAPQVEKKDRLASVPVAVKPTTNNNGLTINGAVEVDTKDEVISCDKDELFNLMMLATRSKTKSLREEITNNWKNLENLFVTELSFGAKALYDAKLRLMTEDILIVTCHSPVEESKLRKKDLQPSLMQICEKTFGKPYKVLVVDVHDFAECVRDIKDGKHIEPHACPIDFGEFKPKSASTAFFDDLMSDDDNEPVEDNNSSLSGDEDADHYDDEDEGGNQDE